jgi:hypothetical protein
MRKKTTALRRKYQRTLKNEELRGIENTSTSKRKGPEYQREKDHYINEKKKYEGAIKKEKINSWK